MDQSSSAGAAEQAQANDGNGRGAVEESKNNEANGNVAVTVEAFQEMMRQMKEMKAELKAATDARIRAEGASLIRPSAV